MAKRKNLMDGVPSAELVRAAIAERVEEIKELELLLAVAELVEKRIESEEREVER